MTPGWSTVQHGGFKLSQVTVTRVVWDICSTSNKKEINSCIINFLDILWLAPQNRTTLVDWKQTKTLLF